ncbi:MAG TPA: hypothetical protein VIY51_11280 [Xanthobacteraceae bacterium]
MPFVPIWHVTANSPAKIAYPIDLMAAVLDGSVVAATQVRDDGAARWIAAGDHPRIAPLLARRAQMAGGFWLFAALTVMLFVPLLASLISGGFHGWITLVGFGMLVMMLQGAHGAARESIALTRGAQVLLYLGSIAAALLGIGLVGALVELGRLTLLPSLPEDSDWLAIPLSIGGVLVFVALSELLWNRWKPHGRGGLATSRPDHPPAVRAAQSMAKVARIKGLIGVDGCQTQVWPNGERYAGKTKQGKRDGHGVYIWAGGARHEGEWHQGKRHGHGVAVTPDGTETAGLWKDDEPAPGA